MRSLMIGLRCTIAYCPSLEAAQRQIQDFYEGGPKLFNTPLFLRMRKQQKTSTELQACKSIVTE